MRLKEPLYGIRIAQMHYLSHLSLLFMMLILEYEIANNDFYIADWDDITVHDTKPSV
jgi:hypothetical protein